MADTWSQYFGGTDEQLDADRQRRQAEYDKLVASKTYRALRGLQSPIPVDGREIDPREARMAMVMDTMYPNPNTDYGADLGKAYDTAGTVAGNVYSGLFETTMRPRDTLIKAAQAYSAGDGWKAAELAARAPLSAVMPSMAAGTPYQEDDWRKDAERLGIHPGNIVALDIFTDPETYLPIPIPFKAAGKAMRMTRPAVSAVDKYGEAIRQLRMAPR